MVNPTVRLLQLSIFILCFFPPGNSVAQNAYYRVIKVKGKVTLASTGKRLAAKQRFKVAEPLAFGSRKDLAVVIDDKAGAFLLRPNASLRGYRAKALNIAMRTRPGYILNDLHLRKFIDQNDSLLLLNGRFSLVMGADAFPMNDKRFFYLQYIWQGDTINKILTSKADTLIFDEKDIYKIDGQPIDPSQVENVYRLYYFDQEKQASTGYKPLHLVKVADIELREEVESLLESAEEHKARDPLLLVHNYLRSLYGCAGEAELAQWLKKAGQ